MISTTVNTSLDIAEGAVLPPIDPIGTFFDEYGSARGSAFLVAMAACSMLGTAGNSITLSVLVSRLRRSRSAATPLMAFKSHYNFFTCALAAADLFVCSVWIPYEVLIVLRLIYSEALCKAMGFLSNAAIIFAAITHFGICVERYYAVCRPTSPVSARQMSMVIAFLGVASAAMSIPAVFTYSVNAAAPADSATKAADASTAANRDLETENAEAGCYYQYDTGVGMYYNAMLGAVLSASIIAMLCVYIVVFRAILKRLLRRWNTRRRAAFATVEARDFQAETTSESTEPTSDGVARPPAGDKQRRLDRASRTAVVTSSSRVAFMFFIVTLVFYASWLPFFLCALDLVQRDVIMENSHFINSCTNFILYSIFNAEMRAEMIQKLTCGKKRHIHSAAL